MKKLLVLAATTVAVLIATAAPAFAHAVLDGTIPAPSSTVRTSPKSVELQFSEPVTFQSNGIRVFNTKGDAVSTGKPQHANGKSNTAAVSIPTLSDGTYVVTWRVISSDTHPVQGAFSFAVGNAQVSSTDSAIAQRLLSKQGGHDTVVGVTFGVVRFLTFVSLALLIGIGAFLVALWPAGWGSTRVQRVLVGSWVVAFLTALAAIPLQAAYASGGGLAKATDSAALSDTIGTRAGHAWIARAILLLVAIPLLRALSRRRDSRPLIVGGVALGALLSLTLSLAGHATTGRWVALAVPADALHVMAMAAWFGGLAVLALEPLRGADIDAVERVVDRFSTMAMSCVAVIVATGAFQSVRQVEHLNDLLHTGYGRLLLVKLGGFAAVLIVASASRDIVRYEVRSSGRAALNPLPAGPGAMLATPDLPEPEDTVRRLRSAVWFEIVFALAVLAVTALLVNAAPVSAQSAMKPYLATVKSADGKTWFEVEVAPARVGANQVHVTAEQPTGVVQPVLQLHVFLSEPAKNIAPIEVKMIRLGPGHYASTGASIPFPGQWTITCKALVTDINEEVGIGTFKAGS
ncbi:MAG: copper resistance protein CopC [Actinomycetia bacterium]|nr:copper resistance protein CopC [Actinomycetes bacterium]